MNANGRQSGQLSNLRSSEAMWVVFSELRNLLSLHTRVHWCPSVVPSSIRVYSRSFAVNDLL